MAAKPVLVAAVLLLGSGVAGGEVKLEVRSDGSKVIRNEPPAARERRLSGRLVAAPLPWMGELIERHATDQALDPRLVQAVMQVESGYNERALSDKGAIGLMQLMPGTARELAVDDPWDPDQNVRGGSTYLRRMLDLFAGDLDFALAAYNAGPNAVLAHSGIPPYEQTRAYVRKVRCLYEGECGGGAEPPSGRKVQILRDAQNRILLTNAGPDG